MTQTAISKQVALLEAALGTRLFERRNRAVFLTEPGRRLARVVGDALAAITDEMTALRGDIGPREVVLHCQLCEAFYWLMPRLPDFHARHPEVELRIVSALSPLTETETPFDVAIQTTGRAAGNARLAFTAADAVFPVCAPDLVAEGAGSVAPAELTRWPLLEHRVTPQDWIDWPGWFDAIGAPRLRTGPKVAFDSYPLALQAAVAGQGVALGWQRTTQAMIDEGKLIRPCVEMLARPDEISVFRGRARHGHPGVTKLLTWLADALDVVNPRDQPAGMSKSGGARVKPSN